MDIEETLPYLHYTENIAKHLWRIVFPVTELQESRQQNERLEMFTKILKFQLDNKHGGMEYQLSLLTINHLSMLSQMMNPQVRKKTTLCSSSRTNPKFSEGSFLLSDFFLKFLSREEPMKNPKKSFPVTAPFPPN